MTYKLDYYLVIRLLSTPIVKDAYLV